jgi:LysM repeat protein
MKPLQGKLSKSKQAFSASGISYKIRHKKVNRKVSVRNCEGGGWYSDGGYTIVKKVVLEAINVETGKRVGVILEKGNHAFLQFD